MADPDTLPGLAHFTEHMLFYASEKYPKEDEYSQWISDRGGHSNAWTSAENTNFQFSVSWDNLESTLDRFAQVRTPGLSCFDAGTPRFITRHAAWPVSPCVASTGHVDDQASASAVGRMNGTEHAGACSITVHQCAHRAAEHRSAHAVLHCATHQP
jgi:hypothetical protein